MEFRSKCVGDGRRTCVRPHALRPSGLCQGQVGPRFTAMNRLSRAVLRVQTITRLRVASGGHVMAFECVQGNCRPRGKPKVFDGLVILFV